MSGSQMIIVDDRNTQYLTYGGGWLSGQILGAYEEYNATTSAPLQTGANVTFAFNGTSVFVYGTSGIAGPVLSCSIDGGTPVPIDTTTSTDPVYHYEVYSATNLADEPHTLLISVTEFGGGFPPGGSTANWFLDYILYTPIAATSLESLEEAQFFFDDTDPAFQYSGSWSTDGSTSEDMQGTLHTPLTLNSSVSLQFTGTFVNVYVRLPYNTSITTIAQVVIDNGPPMVVNYPPTVEIPFDPTTSASSNYRLFHGSFSSGSHQLVITPLAEQALWLDYVTAGIGADTSNPLVSGSSSPSSSSPSSSTPSTLSSTPSVTASSSSKSKTGIIAGGALGGIACLALIAFVIFVRLRSQRRKDNTEKHYDDELPEGGIIPFNANPDNSALVIPYNLDLQDVGGSNGNATLVGEGRREKVQRLRYEETVPRTSESSQITSSSALPAASGPPVSTNALAPPRISSLKQHHDSGIRGLAPQASEELPPIYTME